MILLKLEVCFLCICLVVIVVIGETPTQLTCAVCIYL